MDTTGQFPNISRQPSGHSRRDCSKYRCTSWKSCRSTALSSFLWPTSQLLPRLLTLLRGSAATTSGIPPTTSRGNLMKPTLPASGPAQPYLKRFTCFLVLKTSMPQEKFTCGKTPNQVVVKRLATLKGRHRIPIRYSTF